MASLARMLQPLTVRYVVLYIDEAVYAVVRTPVRPGLVTFLSQLWALSAGLAVAGGALQCYTKDTLTLIRSVG